MTRAKLRPSSRSVPASVLVTEKIDESYQASIQQTIEDTRNDNQQIQDTVGEEEDDSVIEKMFNKVKGGVNGQLEKFENTLNKITESIAVLIVTSCAIPIAVIIFFDRNDLIDGHAQDRSKNYQVIDGRHAFPALPAIDSLRIGKSEHDLQFSYRDPRFLSHSRDILSCFP